MNNALPQDHAQRMQAILERECNVIVDAGAGTGKTTLLVARLVHLLAPEDDGPCFPLDRVAAITFTRKAAGELKLRLRQALLAEHARGDLSSTREQRLLHSIDRLDNAPLGTVHSFADRLLRMRPAAARISPQYDLVEETDDLVSETHAWLVEAAEQGTLQVGLAGTGIESLAEEAKATIQLFQAAGFPTHTVEYEFYAKMGLDWLMRDMIATRDRELTLPDLEPPDLGRVRRVVDELGRELSELQAENAGVRALQRLLRHARAIADASDANEALRRARGWVLEYRRTDLQMKRDFPGDAIGWQAWKWFAEGERGRGKSKELRVGGPLADELTAPLLAWIARRLVRLRPVVLARYLQVKRARQVLDQVDLLIELRDLLRRDLDARVFYQARFDHIVVDEFQDTDPLQAEILMMLCGQGGEGTNINDLAIAPGKLTIVGDPKQSIYRFRRADIGMYAKVCDSVRKGPVREIQLSVNFRSTPELIDWFNFAFDEVLGKSGAAPLYDAETGVVCNLRLAAGRTTEAGPSVHVLPFGDASLAVDASRDIEGEALARYLCWLVEESAIEIVDAHTKKARRPRYADIAVLVVSTQTVHHLLTELDLARVPHVVRGGTLFMQDTLHQQFVLGLRALSDSNDGVAQAALMRPPFFAVRLDDLVRDRFKADDDAPSAVLQQVRAIVSELRFTRNQYTPGETARRLLEQTGFGRFVAASENGAQRLARLYELCLALDTCSRTAGLDFDGTTALARTWLDSPIRIEAPLPVDADAVQVITVHQAKGLEWPVVALWDGRAGWTAYLAQPALSVDAVTGEWAIALDGLSYDPSGRQIREREMKLLQHERKRVLYVAATRARDLLIVPHAGEPTTRSMAGALLLSTKLHATHRLSHYKGDGAAWWDAQPGISVQAAPVLHEDLENIWASALAVAVKPNLMPVGISSAAHHQRVEATEGRPAPPPRRDRKSRYGPTFGMTVHRALELVLTKRVTNPDAAIAQAAGEFGLTLQLEAALADVERAVDALEKHGITRGTMRLEYPIAGSLETGALLAGYVDLLVATTDGIVVVDFKTDDPPSSDVAAHYPEYVAQVHAYRRVLENAGVTDGRAVRAALLFTGDGGLRWV